MKNLFFKIILCVSFVWPTVDAIDNALRAKNNTEYYGFKTLQCIAPLIVSAGLYKASKLSDNPIRETTFKVACLIGGFLGRNKLSKYTGASLDLHQVRNSWSDVAISDGMLFSHSLVLAVNIGLTHKITSQVTGTHRPLIEYFLRGITMTSSASFLSYALYAPVIRQWQDEA